MLSSIVHLGRLVHWRTPDSLCVYSVTKWGVEQSKNSTTNYWLEEKLSVSIHSFIFYNKQCPPYTLLDVWVTVVNKTLKFLCPLCICTTYTFMYMYSYVPHYSFICRKTSRVFPHPSYCKQCCSEDWSAYVFLNYCFFQGVCPAVGFHGHTVALCLVVFLKGNAILFSTVVVQINIPTNRVRQSLTHTYGI